ncbi:MAG: ABC transporter ATP-binding protein [Rhodospirillaceae bacterium]|nr:ABC transporter ATP-binding protein [Rhodospirillaceae bacterium]
MSQLIATHLGVSFGEKTVLDGLSVSFDAAQVTAVVGPNGAGKSTLLMALAGLRAPDRGHVSVDGADIYSLPARDRAQRMGFPAQTPEIAWGVDVRTLVGLGRTPRIGSRGLTAADDEIVTQALAATDVTAFADRNVLTLSGGERGRALIARALAGEPKWLLADEPLTGLDPGFQLDIASLFRGMTARGCGVIVTLHDLHMALRMADRVLVLGEGRVLADGAPQEALSPETLMRAYGVEARTWPGAAGPVIEIVGRRG